VIVAATVLAFLLMTELEPPVLRASILFWVVCLGWLLGRPALSFNTLAAGVIVVLLARPGDLFSASFQLSFLAVLGMLFVVRRIEESLLSPFREAHELAHPGRPPGFWYRQVVVGMLLVSVGATMVSLPVIATRFHVVSWLSPLASAILFPIVFVLTVAGMALAAFGWIAPWLGQVLAVLTDGLGRTIAGVVLALAKAPGAYFYVPDISPAWLIVLYTLMIAWVARERLGIPRRRLAIVALAAATLFVWTAGHHAPRATRATFVAVGAGNCNFLELPNGRNILYDAGSSLSNVRAAQTAIAPALWSRGIGRVDAAFFSHPHFDHFKDILPLVERFGVRQVFVPPTFLRKRLKSDKAVVQALLARGVQVEFFGAGDELAGTGDVNIRGIWPRGPAAVTKSLNLGSLVLQVTDGPRRLLLTGDLTPGGMEALARAEPGLRADAALWPHHGHDPDAFGRFAAAVGARTVVISDGRPFLPRASPPWLRALGGKCYHTGEDGAVTLELRPAGVYAETFAGGPQVLCDLPEPEEDADSADD
jgi:competence protein ComEC